MSGVDWSAYNLPAIWSMIDKENVCNGADQVLAWDGLAASVRDQRERLLAATERLAAIWPPDKNASAQVYLDQVNALARSMQQTLVKAEDTKAGLNGVITALGEAQMTIRSLAAGRQDVSTDWKPRFMDHAEDEYDKKAQQAMRRAEAAVRDHSSQIQPPPLFTFGAIDPGTVIPDPGQPGGSSTGSGSGGGAGSGFGAGGSGSGGSGSGMPSFTATPKPVAVPVGEMPTSFPDNPPGGGVGGPGGPGSGIGGPGGGVTAPGVIDGPVLSDFTPSPVIGGPGVPPGNPGLGPIGGPPLPSPAGGPPGLIGVPPTGLTGPVGPVGGGGPFGIPAGLTGTPGARGPVPVRGGAMPFGGVIGGPGGGGLPGAGGIGGGGIGAGGAPVGGRGAAPGRGGIIGGAGGAGAGAAGRGPGMMPGMPMGGMAPGRGRGGQGSEDVIEGKADQQWSSSEGVAPVIEPERAPVRHDPGPGVIGFHR